MPLLIFVMSIVMLLLRMNVNESLHMSKFEKIFGLACAAVCVLSLVLSLVSLNGVRRLQVEVETLTNHYVHLSESVEAKLSSIDDRLTFLQDWCAQAPSVTLGDTYINNDGKKTKLKSN